jgi:hypothetical protein
VPSSLTKVGVWNLAIDIIKDTALQTTLDNASTARWLERNWQHTVESCIRSYPWNCAKRYYQLSAAATAPLFKWSYAYTLPAGWLRVMPVTSYGARGGTPVPHEVVGNSIYTDEPAPLSVVLLTDISANPGAWDPLLVEMVRCTLALGMANKFTGKAQYIQVASSMLKAAQAKAEEIDAFEGTAEPIEQHDVIRVRGV